jgi:predicted ATPase
MSPDAIRKLSARVGLPPDFAVAGIPLRIEQLGALFTEVGTGAAVAAAGEFDPLRAAIDARFEALPLEIRETLAAASILGRSFWRFALERVLGRDAEEGLVEARRGGWILEREGSLMRADGELLFRHELLREAAESSLSPGAPQQLHAVAAELYAQRAPLAGPAAAARAAWHRAEAARA